MNKMLKRIFDIVFSVLGIIIFSPAILIISFIIKISSKGEIFYSSFRVGKNQNEFKLLKFRTMLPDSDKTSITVGDRDSRITKVGYILRKTKLDELPQLFNVLVGNLSFVGPRPDVKKYIKYYKKEFAEYYKMKPGITSYSSIYFRNESELYVNAINPELIYINETIPKKVQLDKKYFLKNNIFIDIKIIFITFISILKIN